jgi:putative Holliday junction resolvase
MPEKAHRTVLAFDFGTNRIGVAVGEPELGTAHPLPAIPAPGFAAIERLVKEWHPASLVVGIPTAPTGPHPLARRVERFARQLRGRFGLPVALVDEAYSSVAAESLLRGRNARRAAIDSIAAQLVLEQHFHERCAA